MSEDNKKENEEVLVSAEDVLNILEFAEGWYEYYNRKNGVYTPQMVNARMQDINMSPIIATADKIDQALDKPKQNEEALIGYSQWLELKSMMFKRVLSYFGTLPSFDFTYVCKNIEKPEEYSSKAYIKDLSIVEAFFEKFDAKHEFKTIMKELVRSEAYFGVLREEGEIFVFQQLPQQFCEITGRFEYGMLFDFDYSWFQQTGVSIDMYPHSFKRKLNEMVKKQKEGGYDPSVTMNRRTGQYAFWHQTSPEDGCFAFKFSPEIASRVPIFSPLMPNAAIEPVIRELQKNSYIAEATKILFGEVPLLKSGQPTDLKDALAISSNNLGRFLALVKSALPDAIKVAAAPLTNAAVLDFTGSETIYDTYLKTSAGSAGVNSRLLYSIDRQNILETKASLDIDENMLRLTYFQFEKFLEYMVNRKTKKYKFKFRLEGFETSIDREERFNTVTKLADLGIVMDQKFASAIGMTPFDFRKMLDETKASGFVDKLTPILKAQQMPSEDRGRPKKSEGDLADSGSDTRSAGSNEEKAEV